MSLVENVKYDGLYIFKYSERPGTPAAKLTDDVSKTEKKARFLELEELQKRQQKSVYESYVGREVNVLAESVSAKSETDFTGHTSCHKVVNFPRHELNLGEITRIRITKAKQNSLYGEIAGA
jgi:tRNA-2-methylthio-N6-dimethylallyladenosine synthase